jgi:hypothetical protein
MENERETGQIGRLQIGRIAERRAPSESVAPATAQAPDAVHLDWREIERRVDANPSAASRHAARDLLGAFDWPLPRYGAPSWSDEQRRAAHGAVARFARQAAEARSFLELRAAANQSLAETPDTPQEAQDAIQSGLRRFGEAFYAFDRQMAPEKKKAAEREKGLDRSWEASGLLGSVKAQGARALGALAGLWGGSALEAAAAEGERGAAGPDADVQRRREEIQRRFGLRSVGLAGALFMPKATQLEKLGRIERELEDACRSVGMDERSYGFGGELAVFMVTDKRMARECGDDESAGGLFKSRGLFGGAGSDPTVLLNDREGPGGTLAHEWAHALDQKAGAVAAPQSQMMFSNLPPEAQDRLPAARDGLRKVFAAMAEDAKAKGFGRGASVAIGDAEAASPTGGFCVANPNLFLRASAVMDQKGVLRDNYWLTAHEVFARAVGRPASLAARRGESLLAPHSFAMFGQKGERLFREGLSQFAAAAGVRVDRVSSFLEIEGARWAESARGAAGLRAGLELSRANATLLAGVDAAADAIKRLGSARAQKPQG